MMMRVTVVIFYVKKPVNEMEVIKKTQDLLAF